MLSFRRIITISIKILAFMHSFNGTAHFSDVKICSEPILRTFFFFKIGSEYALVLKSRKLMSGDLRFYYMIFPDLRLLALDALKGNSNLKSCL